MSIPEPLVTCTHCGKKLIARTPNGALHFRFGRRDDNEAVVDMIIIGTVQLKCWSKVCGKINIISSLENP